MFRIRILPWWIFGWGGAGNASGRWFTSGEFDEPKPTPTPAPGEEFTDDMYDGVQARPGFTDGTPYFYQILDYDSEPYCGTGTEEDPYVFLCSSSGGSVRVRGSFSTKWLATIRMGQEWSRKAEAGFSWNSTTWI